MGKILQKYNYGTGRRKTSIARVFMKPGSGKIIVNKLELNKYFSRKTACMIIKQPLNLTKKMSLFDFMVTVKGGGTTGQSGAIRLGIARALIEFDIDLKSPLKKEKLLTRDPREVERKKVGLKKARKKRQFSKR